MNPPFPALVRLGRPTRAGAVTRWSVALMGAFSPGLHAQSLDQVVVTATRYEVQADRALADVTVIDAQRIRDAGVSSVTELLRAAGGLEITQNGGLGAASGVFLRGTKPAQTVVLIDGIRTLNPMFGMAPLELLPLSAIERIEIVRAPASTLYGSGAMGGVIQIITRDRRGPPSLDASAGVGSQGSLQTRARVAGGDESSTYSFLLSREVTRGFDASSRADDCGQSDRDGSHRSALNAAFTHRVGPALRVGVNVFAAQGANAFDAGDSGSDVRAGAVSAFLQAVLTQDWLSEVKVGTSATRYDSRYLSTWGADACQAMQREFARGVVDTVNWQNTVSVEPNLRLLFGVDHQQERVEGDGVTRGATLFEQSSRSTDSVFAGAEKSYGRQLWRMVVRHDRIGLVGGDTNGTLSWGFRPREGWLLRASAGTAFRAPTFADLYYPGYSNPLLKPERSRTLEFGLDRQWRERSQARVTAFRTHIQDAIEFDAGYVPRNIAAADIQGATLGVAHRIDAWLIEASVTIQDPVGEVADPAAGVVTHGPLSRRSRRHGVLGVSRQEGPWRLGVQALGQGARMDGSASLGGYGIIDAWAAYRVDAQWEAFLRAGNLGDRRYETAYGFAMPPRTVFLGMRFAQRQP